MKRLTFLLVFALAVGIAGCSEDDSVVDQGLPEVRSILTNLTLSEYGFDTDTLNIPDVGEKNPDDPIDIPIDFTVDAVPAAGSSIDAIRIVVTPQGSSQAVVDQTFDSHDGIVFSGTFNMSIARNNADDYNVLVTATDSRGEEVSPAISKIVVLYGSFPPVFSNFQAPDSVKRPTEGSTSFLFTVKVTDKSGQKDIRRVFYRRISGPDGPGSATGFPMLDDGKSPDAVAADSIYTAGARIESTNLLGEYVFEFQAQDRSGLTAIPITHKIIVY